MLAVLAAPSARGSAYARAPRCGTSPPAASIGARLAAWRTAPAWGRVPGGDWVHGTGGDDHYDFLAMGIRPGELVVERR